MFCYSAPNDNEREEESRRVECGHEAPSAASLGVSPAPCVSSPVGPCGIGEWLFRFCRSAAHRGTTPFRSIVFPLGHLPATAMAIAELTVAEDRDFPSSGRLEDCVGPFRPGKFALAKRGIRALTRPGHRSNVPREPPATEPPSAGPIAAIHFLSNPVTVLRRPESWWNHRQPTPSARGQRAPARRCGFFLNSPFGTKILNTEARRAQRK